eukprot:COSAG02_NODE_3355_length_6880_cov_5.035835_5_plen_55_part_01
MRRIRGWPSGVWDVPVLLYGYSHTVHLLETQVWMRKIFSAPADPYINRSVLRSAF